MLRYRVPERIHIPKGPASAFGAVPSFRKFKVFVDATSFTSGLDTPICWYVEDSRFRTWSNHPGVGHCIEERLDDELGSTMAYKDGETGIPQWQTWKPWVREVIPAHLHEEAIQKLPALVFARIMELDAFVTESVALLTLRDQEGSKRFPTIVDADEALALVGLYRRFRHDYSYRLGSAADLSIGRLGYDALASQVAFPGVHVLQHYRQGVEVRLARALYARDRIYQCYFNSNECDLGDEAFFFLDAFLVSLVAAFDALGRDVHRTLGLDGSERRVDWGGKWREEHLKPKHTALFSLTKKNVKTGAVMTLCATLRNYVHGFPLLPVDFVDVQEGRRTLALHIPEDERDAIYNVMQTLGGDWQILVRDGDLMIVDVPTLVERLLGASLQALKELTAALHPTASAPEMPAAVGHLPETLQPRVVEACRALLGLEV